MSTDERAAHLETGSGATGDEAGRLDRVRSILARAETWAEPPADLIDRVLEDVAGEPVPAGRWSGWPSAAIAAALALVLVGLIAFVDSGEPRPAGTVIAMTGTELAPAATGEARIEERPSGWYVHLEVRGLPPAGEGSYYEAWLWRNGEGVSMGTFHLRSPDPVALWSGVSPEDYPVVRITLQDESGGPAPSGRVVMTGMLPGPWPR